MGLNEKDLLAEEIGQPQVYVEKGMNIRLLSCFVRHCIWGRMKNA